MGLESEHEAHAVFLIRDAGGIEVFSHYAAA